MAGHIEPFSAIASAMLNRNASKNVLSTRIVFRLAGAVFAALVANGTRG